MNAKQIESRFREIGARLKVREIPSRWRQGERQWVSPVDYAVDIQRDRHGEFFEFRLPTHLADHVETTVLQVAAKQRHLLLLVRKTEDEPKLDRFLCGHDEREWFFVPEPSLVVDEKLVLRNEPLRRGAGKPHLVEQLFRTGGEVVRVCGKHPNGITNDAYRALLKTNPKSAHWDWRVMRRNPGVYGRGTVRHSDHATILLPFWHRVLMNTESESRTMANVAFLD